MSNAIWTDVSTTVTISGTLVAGPNDHFEVVIWFDNLFGTFAFQQSTPTTTPRFSGTGAPPLSIVTVETGGLLYTTVADTYGAYAFFAPTMLDGEGTLTVGGNAPAQVSIGQGEPSTGFLPKHLVHSTGNLLPPASMS